MRLAELFLAPVALGPSSATRDALLAAARRHAGARGRVETFTAEGDEREPARIHALFATPGAARRRGTIVFLHGKGGSGAEWRTDVARALSLGLNVLVPELRGHPPSGGSRVTYGHLEKVDVASLLRGAAERFGIDPENVGVDGCSLGALVALHVPAVHPVRALWLQSPFGKLPLMAAHYASRATGLPACVVSLPARLALLEAQRTSGLDFRQIDPVAAAARVTSPAMVVHGEADVLVPAAAAREVYDALAGEKGFWSVPRCGHCHHPEEPQGLRALEYAERWTAFFGRHLRGPGRSS